MKRVVAFDFDGTYTLQDTLPEFLKKSFGTWRYWWGVLVCLPWILLFKVRLLQQRHRVQHPGSRINHAETPLPLQNTKSAFEKARKQDCFQAKFIQIIL